MDTQIVNSIVLAIHTILLVSILLYLAKTQSKPGLTFSLTDEEAEDEPFDPETYWNENYLKIGSVTIYSYNSERQGFDSSSHIVVPAEDRNRLYINKAFMQLDESHFASVEILGITNIDLGDEQRHQLFLHVVEQVLPTLALDYFDVVGESKILLQLWNEVVLTLNEFNYDDLEFASQFILKGYVAQKAGV